jgi:hypothetical protein
MNPFDVVENVEQNNTPSNDWRNKGGYQNNWNKSGSNGKSNWNGNKGGYPKKNQEPEEIKLYKPYVGIGNKEAPQDILDQMRRLATELNGFGYLLRTGGLDGPDAAFEAGASGNVEVHLPWKGFADKESKFTFTGPLATGVAKMFHPSFDTLKPVVQTFLAKNARMVLGKDVKSPALFMICWSDDGVESVKNKTSKTGNIGHAIAIASSLHIPIFNLANHDAEIRLKRYLGLPNGESPLTEI